MRAGYHHGDLARALLEAAGAMVARGEEPTMRAVAAATEVTASAAYRHYADRDDLLAAVAADWLARLAEAMTSNRERTAAGADPLLVVALTYLDGATAQPALFRLAAGPHGLGRSGGVRGEGPDGPAVRRQFALAAGPAAGDLMWSATHGLAALVVDGPFTRQSSTSMLVGLLRSVRAM